MDKLITYVGLDVSAGMTRCDLLLRIHEAQQTAASGFVDGKRVIHNPIGTASTAELPAMLSYDSL